MKCKSGRHEWTDPADAEKCCNGWRRELRVGTMDGRPWFAHVWVKVVPAAEQPKGGVQD